MMNHEVLSTALEVLLGLMIIPWCVFVTNSLFSLKQQLALLKQEIQLLRKVELMIDQIHTPHSHS